jgi:hypothetical protein
MHTVAFFPWGYIRNVVSLGVRLFGYEQDSPRAKVYTKLTALAARGDKKNLTVNQGNVVEV